MRTTYENMYVQQRDKVGETERERKDSGERSRKEIKESVAASYVGRPRNAIFHHWYSASSFASLHFRMLLVQCRIIFFFLQLIENICLTPRGTGQDKSCI